MKIYINNLNLELLKDISELFKENLINCEKYIELYTEEGIYNIQDKFCHQLHILDKDIKRFDKYYENFTLIVDPSYFNEEQINSIQGNIHESIQITKQAYKLNKSSSLQIIIKFCNENKKLIPYDIYLYSNKDIDINDILIKKEIIEFLSVLN